MFHSLYVSGCMISGGEPALISQFASKPPFPPFTPRGVARAIRRPSRARGLHGNRGCTLWCLHDGSVTGWSNHRAAGAALSSSEGLQWPAGPNGAWVTPGQLSAQIRSYQGAHVRQRTASCQHHCYYRDRGHFLHGKWPWRRFRQFLKKPPGKYIVHFTMI